MMFGENYYVNLVVDLIVGNPARDLPREFRNPIIDEEAIQDFAITLREHYPNDVQRGIWAPMNLRRVIDSLLDESNPIVKSTIFGNHFFSESERQIILNKCAATACKKLQRCIGARSKVCYKVMPNGRVGYRLE